MRMPKKHLSYKMYPSSSLSQANKMIRRALWYVLNTFVLLIYKEGYHKENQQLVRY